MFEMKKNYVIDREKAVIVTFDDIMGKEDELVSIIIDCIDECARSQKIIETKNVIAYPFYRINTVAIYKGRQFNFMERVRRDDLTRLLKKLNM